MLWIMKNTAKNKDINIRIDKETHKKIKVDAARYGMPIKQAIAIFANFGLKKTLSAIMDD